ncbi:hypothetical protein BDF22DRAFT_93836 [Syncephalis plumigaleata]|nr:hypothetical protein BDF22DRAFT_93836 [Syncephalis plumigaleata]
MVLLLFMLNIPLALLLVATPPELTTGETAPDISIQYCLPGNSSLTQTTLDGVNFIISVTVLSNSRPLNRYSICPLRM